MAVKSIILGDATSKSLPLPPTPAVIATRHGKRSWALVVSARTPRKGTINIERTPAISVGRLLTAESFCQRLVRKARATKKKKWKISKTPRQLNVFVGRRIKTTVPPDYRAKTVIITIIIIQHYYYRRHYFAVRERQSFSRAFLP